MLAELARPRIGVFNLGCRVPLGRDEDGTKPGLEHEFSLVDVSGDAAVARVELHRDGKHTFTDYLSLYRTGGGWRIVGKIFLSWVVTIPAGAILAIVFFFVFKSVLP